MVASFRLPGQGDAGPPAAQGGVPDCEGAFRGREEVDGRQGDEHRRAAVVRARPPALSRGATLGGPPFRARGERLFASASYGGGPRGDQPSAGGSERREQDGGGPLLPNERVRRGGFSLAVGGPFPWVTGWVGPERLAVLLPMVTWLPLLAIAMLDWSRSGRLPRAFLDYALH